MNKMIHILLAIGILTGTTQLFGQTGDRMGEIERELNRLQMKIQDARQLLQILQNPDMQGSLQLAEENYQRAREAFQNRQYVAAAAFIKLGYSHLAQFYQQLKNNPFLKRKFIERLDQKIQEAEQVVMRSQNTEAEKLLRRAKYFRQRAIRQAQSDRIETVIKNYFIAQFFAENAIRTAGGQDLPDIKNFDRFLEESHMLLSQVAELAEQNPGELINHTITRARMQLEKVQQLYEQKMFRQAYQNLMIVNRFLYRALDLLENKAGSVSDRLEMDLLLLDEQIVEARQEVTSSGNEEAQRIYERVVFLASAARQNYQSKDYQAARNRIGIANRLLYQLNRHINRITVDDREQLENQMATAEIMLGSLRDHSSENHLYLQLLQVLEKNYQYARREINNGNHEGTIYHLKFFNGLALKMEQVKAAQNQNMQKELQVEEGLNRLKSLLDNPPAELGQNRILKSKYETAADLYDIARQACQEGQYQTCNQITRMATNLITQ